MVVTKRWRGMRWTQAVSKDERYRCGRQSRVDLTSRPFFPVFWLFFDGPAPLGPSSARSRG